MPKKKTTAKKKTATNATKNLDHITENLRRFAVPIDSIEMDPANERAHDEKNLAAIGASLKAHGQVSTLLVNSRNNQVVIGNGRLLAAKQLGWTHIAVVTKDLSEAKQRSLRIADNRTAELAGWDDAMLQASLVKFAEEDDGAGALYDALLLDDLYKLDDGVEEETEQGTAQPVPDKFEVVVVCVDEADQKKLYARMKKEKRQCRLLTL